MCAVPVDEPLALAGHHAQTADVVAVALLRSAGGKIGAGQRQAARLQIVLRLSDSSPMTPLQTSLFSGGQDWVLLFFPEKFVRRVMPVVAGVDTAGADSHRDVSIGFPGLGVLFF